MNRIPLDGMTSDQLDALYERLEAAEATVARATDAVMNQSYLVSLDEALLTALDAQPQPNTATAAGP